MFGTLRNNVFGAVRACEARIKAIFTKAREVTKPVAGYTALRVAAATAKRRSGSHSYIPPTFEFEHTVGERGRSQRQRSNRRKAAANTHAS